MRFDGDVFDRNLSTALDDDHALIAELRAAFAASASRQVDLLKRSRCDANWRIAALRLHGLAVSFHAEELAALAEQTLAAAPGDPVALRALDKHLAHIFEA